jgi:hypothetical protein
MRRPAVFVFMLRLLTLLLPFALLAADPARVNLNLGNGSNDGTGDGLRTTFTKINTNVINLWSQAFTNNPASIAGKLDATNGTAINLTGSLTNVAIYGDTVIDTGDELQDTVDYSLALTPNGNTATSNDASARPRSVATISSLVVDVDPLLVPTYARVSVLGYHTAGDGGGGDFRRVLASSGTTNAGTFFASTANALYAWERVASEPYTPAMFGAVGDGVTDDTIAVQAWADAGGNLSLGKRPLKITSPITLPSNTGIVGSHDAIIHLGEALTNNFDSVFYATNVSGISLVGVEAMATNQVPAYLLRLDLGTDISITRCRVEKLGLLVTRGFTNPTLPASESSAINAIDAIDGSLQSRIKVADNIAIGDGVNTSSTHAAARVDYAADVQFSGNIVSGYYYGLFGLGGMRLFVDSGTAYDSYSPGRALKHTSRRSDRITFSGNHATNCVAPFWYAGGRNIAFSGNVVETCDDVGIDIEFCTETAVTGNTVNDAQNGGISFYDGCDNLTISGNTVIVSANATFSACYPLSANGGGLATNIVVSGNLFFNNSSAAKVQNNLGLNSGGFKSLLYSGNRHYNVNVVSKNGLSGSALIAGNSFDLRQAMETETGALTVHFAANATWDIKGNTFTFTPDERVVSSVNGSSEITLSTGDYEFTTGEAVVYYAYGSTLSALVNGAVYYANSVSSGVIKLYDTAVNAMAGTATGLQTATSLTITTTAPRIQRYVDSQYAIRLIRRGEGTARDTVQVNLAENTYNWQNMLWAGVRSADYTTANSTNSTGLFLRGISPLRIVSAGEIMREQAITQFVVRHDMLGNNCRLVLDRSMGWDGAGWPKLSLTNVIVAKGSVVLDASFDTTTREGLVAEADGWWVNGLAATNWVTATAYSAGDLVYNSSRSYACVIGGTSSSAPTGSGDAAGIVRDGSLVWVNLGSVPPLAGYGVGQFGYRVRAGTPYAGNRTAYFLGEMFYDTTDKIWYRAAGFTSSDWIPLSPMGAVETLTYSGTTVTVTGQKGSAQQSLLTCTNDFTLAFTSLAADNAGQILVAPAATNCTVTLPSYAFGPSGRSLTISGGTGNTNYTIIAWINTVVGGTNRVSVNALNYY